MTNNQGEQRHTRADAAEVVSDPKKQAEQEAFNALRQAQAIQDMVDEWLQPGRTFRLRPSMLLTLHRYALEGLSSYAGNWRPAGVRIEGSKHTPPEAHLVAEFVEFMCDYVNENWAKPAIHLSAYCMWRLNWIHPFSDGNGRTSRAISYFVLSMRLGYRLPGVRTIPDQIVENRQPYFDALDAADEADRAGVVDVSKMEELLETLLSRQLLAIHTQAVSPT